MQSNLITVDRLGTGGQFDEETTTLTSGKSGGEVVTILRCPPDAMVFYLGRQK